MFIFHCLIYFPYFVTMQGQVSAPRLPVYLNRKIKYSSRLRGSMSQCENARYLNLLQFMNSKSLLPALSALLGL